MIPGQELVLKVLMYYTIYMAGFILLGPIYIRYHPIKFIEVVFWPLLPVTLLIRAIIYLINKEIILDKIKGKENSISFLNDILYLKFSLRKNYVITRYSPDLFHDYNNTEKTIFQSKSKTKAMTKWLAMKV